MQLSEAKEKYIQTWGTLATNWGINRTMAQVHALLLAEGKALSTDEVMQMLEISRGNANMNLRNLMEWGLVRKELMKGDRKEYFFAERDMWYLFKQLVKERKKREIEPVLNSISELKNVEENTEEAKKFTALMEEMENVTGKVFNIMDLAIKSDDHWLVGKITNLLK
ncbi:Sugar-specific transcriptional regulator TrmB [Chryseobacterium sp. MOF25P]|uniref:GbsR/MarR family transcriptional regulator n=1 Tax=unclassified Chryseobacterium TaxID=2593645 RepID=UPI0008058AE9|nr:MULTISPECIES: helix-turn-helix domain-containing protein [unclassified Chryseobacterium]OBW42457.1 Sugar-specific transcriptional regulator TrmB [Chryseobacterium sp. MOF25P]OBW47391.1 Sugar-specific transcriptional regulator TrmB [Chryseobacterium sp. BGARF1]